ncbi:MAG TPA: hypothetical protein VFE23_03275 [Usitatibacter sp.]|jgi:hypothetical protein|nr:hypothetical protein [Usitatibacter sp.]
MALGRVEECNRAIVDGVPDMVDFHLPQRWLPPHRLVRAGDRQRPGIAAGFDASAAIIASLVAGSVVLIAWIACSTTIYDEPAWKLPRMMAALIAGPTALEPQDEPDVTLVATGFVLHYLLALGFGAVLAMLLRCVRDGAVAWVGAAFGLALYVGDLHGMTAFFPWFTPLRTADTVAAHVLFGILAATAYRHLARRR